MIPPKGWKGRKQALRASRKSKKQAENLIVAIATAPFVIPLKVLAWIVRPKKRRRTKK